MRSWRWQRAWPVVVVATLAAAGTAFAAPSGGATSSWRSGVYCGSYEVGCVDAFGAWRGRSAEVVGTFTGKETWERLVAPDFWLQPWSTHPYRDRVVVTVPLLPDAGDADDPSPSLAEGAAGDYDGHFVELAQRLRDAGLGSTVVRLGHELNGTWYRWSARPDPAAYAGYWRHAVAAMRSVGGTSFRFTWNIGVGSGLNAFDATKAWPGDDVVDYVGIDVYDTWWGQPLSPEQRWDRLVDPGGAVPQGLKFWADFAAAHGKPNSFDEWGLVGDGASMGNGGEGRDNPYFIQQMHEWFASHATAYEVYFNRNPSDGRHVITGSEFPDAAEAYLAAFGTGSSSAPASPRPSAVRTPSPTPSPGGATTLPTPSVAPSGSPSSAPTATPTAPPSCPTTILVSAHPDRSGAVPLCGRTVTEPFYVFGADGAAAVSYFLDNPDRSGLPDVVELAAPFDLGGTSIDGSARPFRDLPPGQHTLTVLVSGPGRTVSATLPFTVRG